MLCVPLLISNKLCPHYHSCCNYQLFFEEFHWNNILFCYTKIYFWFPKSPPKGGSRALRTWTRESPKFFLFLRIPQTRLYTTNLLKLVSIRNLRQSQSYIHLFNLLFFVFRTPGIILELFLVLFCDCGRSTTLNVKNIPRNFDPLLFLIKFLAVKSTLFFLSSANKCKVFNNPLHLLLTLWTDMCKLNHCLLITFFQLSNKFFILYLRYNV